MRVFQAAIPTVLIALSAALGGQHEYVITFRVLEAPHTLDISPSAAKQMRVPKGMLRKMMKAPDSRERLSVTRSIAIGTTCHETTKMGTAQFSLDLSVTDSDGDYPMLPFEIMIKLSEREAPITIKSDNFVLAPWGEHVLMQRILEHHVLLVLVELTEKETRSEPNIRQVSSESAPSASPDEPSM